jgi:pilus assembly protein CpaE
MTFQPRRYPQKPLSIVAMTPDREFEASVKKTFGAHPQIELNVIAGPLNALPPATSCDLYILDIDHATDDVLRVLQRALTSVQALPPIVVVTHQFDERVGRALVQMRIADFLVKPVPPVDLVRACARVTQVEAARQTPEAKIYSFLPASGGAGVTTLAVQTAMLLLNNRGTRTPSSTCLVDLDFQHGSVADYLDVEPRLNLAEVEPKPDRLDRQLLEVMLSYHSSGLAIIAAPSRPAEMLSFDPDVVTRLLDLVSGHFENVVFDMPRTWFAWTDDVLLGSNHIYVVSESTVPGLRHARNLVAAIKERLGDRAEPRVIVNRFQQTMFSTGLRRADIEQALGSAYITAIPNDYALVREAIDRGVPLEEVKPGNKITQEMKKLVLAQGSKKTTTDKGLPLLAKLGLATARPQP